MIKRLYVDNYKCLVNFELALGSLQLLLGPNGTGKTSTFELLDRVKQLVVFGGAVAELFPVASLTVWQKPRPQRFEFDIEGNGGLYTYTLSVSHDLQQGRSAIQSEELRFDGIPLYVFDGRDVHLYPDDGSQGPVFPSDASRSGISSLPSRPEMARLNWFRLRLARIYWFAINPSAMESQTEDETFTPDRDMSDFVAWYRSLAQASPELMEPLFKSLSQVIDGFLGLKLEFVSQQARILHARFRSPADAVHGQSEYMLPLDRLSDGQRCLLALFTLLQCVRSPDYTFCIDEPDNYVALRELQPWLLQLSDATKDSGSQCLIVSHHPEFINTMAPSDGILFGRVDHGPVRTKRFDWNGNQGLTPAELVARGWEEWP